MEKGVTFWKKYKLCKLNNTYLYDQFLVTVTEFSNLCLCKASVGLPLEHESLRPFDNMASAWKIVYFALQVRCEAGQFPSCVLFTN